MKDPRLCREKTVRTFISFMKAHTFVHSQQAEYYQNKMFNKIHESKEIVTVSIFLKGVSESRMR